MIMFCVSSFKSYHKCNILLFILLLYILLYIIIVIIILYYYYIIIISVYICNLYPEWLPDVHRKKTCSFFP